MALAESLRDKAARGVVLVSGLKVAGAILGRVTAVILPLYLVPYDYGVFGLAVVLSGFLTFFADFGISTELVRRKERLEEAFRTAFALQTTLAFALVGVSIVLGWAAALVYGEPNLWLPIIVLAVGLVFQAISMIPRVIATRNLDFRRAAIPDSIGKLSAGFMAIGFAVGGLAFWSPVIATVLGAAIGATLQLTVSGWRPRIEFQRGVARELFGFGRFVTFAALLNFVAHSLDDLIVGGVLGLSSVGYYVVAYSWGVYFIAGFSSILSTVAYPVLSRVADLPDRLRRAFLQNLRYYSYLGWWVGPGVFVFAPLFVTSIYGNNWVASIRPMQVLAPVGVLFGYSVLAQDALYASGRPRDVLRASAVELLAVIVLVPLGVIFGGLLGTSLAVFGGALVLTTLLAARASPAMGISRADWLSELRTPVTAAGLSSVLGAAIVLFLPPSVPTLGFGVGVFTVTYFVTLNFQTKGRFWSEVLDNFRRVFRAKGGGRGS